MAKAKEKLSLMEGGSMKTTTSPIAGHQIDDDDDDAQIVRPHEAPEEALTMGPLMKYLLWYLEESSGEPSDWEYDVDICVGLPWNRDTVMFVLSYVFHFISNLEEHSDISASIMALDDIAKCLHDLTEKIDRKHEINTKEAELSEMLVNVFFPDVVRRFFTVPKLHQLPPSDNHLYPNEVIAGFMDFLLQVLYHQTNISEDQVQLWAPVWKELSFLLAVLGDIPFQCTHHHEIVQETKILLAEFEMLSNEAGSFVYDAVFSIHQMESNKFHEETTGWFQKVELLNAKIKEHCLKFSELPMSVIARSSVVDSLFIIHSLIEDIENLKNHTLNFNHGDAILELMKELHGKLTLSLSLIKDMQDNEEKEDLIRIRDLTYEAEYLINSLVVGNIDVWYLNLRLPSIIHGIKLAAMELEQTETKVIKASDGKVSFPTTGIAATMEENHFPDFNDYMKMLEHGYKHLPCNIKPCFLYFAGFPKDSEISQEKLTWLWISEGFIQKQGNKSPEEIAEMYLLDLISRELLFAERGLDGAKKSCKLYSQLHDFVVKKANEENFIKFTNSGFSMYERCQRLCVPSTESCNYWRPFGLHCRSYRDLRTRLNSSSFQTMALLKVVDQSPEYYGSNLSSALAFPAQLRYLAVVCNLSSKMVANLVNLELIYANIISEDRVYVPSVVLRMVKLRHLVVKWSAAEFEEDWCSNITKTTNLRILSGVRIIENKYEDILRCSPHLQKLKCSFTDKTRFPDLSFLPELESLKVYFENGLSAKILSSKINIPLTIRKLSLTGSKLPWVMISILGRLPNLNVLKLGEDAFVGDVWETIDGEFQKLKYLEIYNSSDLRLWISCSEHFPVLECLVLSCRALVEIPSDFGNIQTLQRIQVECCTKEACLSALQLGKHIQLDITNDGWKKDELIQKCTNTSLDDLKDMFSCMEEYFQAGSSKGFINNLPIITDLTEDKKIDEDAFVSRDVLSYMEQYFQAGATKESKTKLKIIDPAEDEMTTTAANDEPLIFVNQRTYFMVFSYGMQFSSTSENQIILGLRCISASYMSRKQFLPGHPCYVDEIKKTRRKFLDMLVNSFIPLLKRFFQIPKMEQLAEKDNKRLNKNEILASFMDFLLQMFCEVNTDSADAKQYSLMQKEFSFLLAVLGDLPFQLTTLPEFDDHLNNLLAEFEMLANEAGSFLFSLVSRIQPMEVSRFHVETNALLEMAKLLNAKIKEHCTNFSELHVSAIVRSTIVDSFFIVDSLVEDLHNIIVNGQLGNFSSDDAIMEQIKMLQGELTLSQRVIKSMRDNDSSNKKEGLIQIRDLTYEAEYLINSLVVGNIHVWYLNLRLPSIVCNIKLARIELQQTSETKVIKAYDEEVSFPTIDDNQFLDFNQDITQRILNDLTGISNTPRKIITIFGMPGVGKTTTATKLYNGKAALSSFDRRAWCVVSAKYDVRALFFHILLDLANGPDENREWKENSEADLGEKVHKILKGRRYLIVLDDVWCCDVLDKLTRYFPDDVNGSRVLITTRNKVVSPDGSISYELPILSKDECWNLLEKKVFPEDPCPSHLVSIGKRITAKCSGVPLAVVSIAGVLVNVEKEESEWKRVEEQLEKVLLDDQSDYSYRKIMELSYEHLPHNLKPCFLYFARYPEDSEISTKELKLIWISQGFVQKDGNKSPEEIAETYLSDLISRSLVMTAQRRSIVGTKTCRIHDLLHDICRKKADEQNFMTSTDLFSTYEKHQHLCLLSSSKNISWRPFGLHCRSFLGCDTEHSFCGFRSMALMKVVELFPKEKHYLQYLSKVDLPCQLRYLGINGDVIPERVVDNLVNLEVLYVRGGYEKVVVVPRVILRMAKLRHLFVRGKAKFEEDGNKMSGATSLISISRVVISKKSDEEILRNSPHLQTLKCIIRGKTIFPDLSNLAELESLRIDYERYKFGGKILLSEASFPSTIKKLCLSRSRLPWAKMSMLGELPNLQVVKLEDDAFVGKEWATKDDQFYKLRFLKISELDLKQWSCESSHFPRLEQVVLSRCMNLLEIPSDLGHISTLQRIEMRGCTNEASLSAIEIEKEQHDLYDNQELQVNIIAHVLQAYHCVFPYVGNM